MLDSLGEVLIQTQLLREEQWQQVRRPLAPDADLRGLLDRIEALPAWWAVGASTPALTNYQKKLIRKLHEKGQLPRLRRMLRRGDYLILQKLGEGGIGIVFKAWDFQERRLVAVKQIKRVSLETYRRFRREARIQKRLAHPCIVRYLQLARVRGDTLLIQEYVDGRTIAQEVKARGPIPWQEAGRWIVDVLCALEHAHRLKIIHRDLKPSNIMLYRQAESVRAKMLDLGLAKCLDPMAISQTTKDVATAGDALLGTLEYMAPEQWRGAEAIVPASDIYSLGCTLFFALTGGRPPFVADSLLAYCNAHTNTPPPRLTVSQSAVPETMDALVQQMLAKDPAKRGSPARLLQQFRNLLQLPSNDSPPRRARSRSLPSPPPPPTGSPAHTPTPQRPLALPRGEHVQPAAANESFLPFPPGSDVNVWGTRNFFRAFVVSRGLFRRILVLLLLGLAVVGLLWMWLRP